MKKKIIRGVIIPLLFAVTLGFYGAKIAYEFYQVKKTIIDKKYNAYAIQYGVYTNDKILEKSLSNLDNYVVKVEDGKYYVYLGFTTSYKNLTKMRDLYEKKDMDIYVKEMYISNSEFVSNLEQFDILLDSVTKEEDILSVNNAILSSYDEIILGN